MTVYLLGAGASHGYDISPTGVAPPLATGLFKAYFDLDISGDIDVKVGTVINYVRDFYDVSYDDFPSFDADAEEFMTLLEGRIAWGRENFPDHKGDPEFAAILGRLGGAYQQTLFLFTHVLNEIANGPVSRDYVDLIAKVGEDATFVTFNWDTLLDRALAESSSWLPDNGYGVRFPTVFDEGWRSPRKSSGARCPTLLKLHGSTNWIGPWIGFDATGNRSVMVEDESNAIVSTRTEAFIGSSMIRDLDEVDDVEEVTYRTTEERSPGMGVAKPNRDEIDIGLFVSGERPFETWRDRWRPHYGSYTYFYPPNFANSKLPTMPVLVAPTRTKEYSVYGKILEPIWDAATRSIATEQRLVIIGYSFPPTDIRARELVAGCRGTILVVNPRPDGVVAALTEMGISPGAIEVFPGTLRGFNASKIA